MYLYVYVCMYDVMLCYAITGPDVCATMQQVNVALITFSSCKYYDSLKSHISPIGLGATFVIIV